MQAKDLPFMTMSEFMKLNKSDNITYELIDNQVYMQARPNVKHQLILTALIVELGQYLKDKPCKPISEAELLIGDNLVVPDIFVYCDDSPNKQSYDGVPIIVIEILSNSTRFNDYNKKMNLYQKHGIKEYWIVNPVTDTITVYNLETTDSIEYTVRDKFSSEVLGDFDMDISSIFS